MSYVYSCEIYNPYNLDDINYIIADESEFIRSPAFLHIFHNERTNEKYCIISDNNGAPLPYSRMNKDFIVGTSRYIYFYDTELKKCERKLLKTPCTAIIVLNKKILVICECDVITISVIDKRVIAEFNFNDTIIDYIIYQDEMCVSLMEGEKHEIKF